MLGADLQHHAIVVIKHVKFAGLILAKGAHSRRAGEQRAARPGAGRIFLKSPYGVACEVAEDVGALKLSDSVATIHKAADNRAALGVVVLGNRQDEPAHVTAARGIKAVRAFHDAPAEIAAACDDVDFLEIILANVSGKQ